MNRQDASDMKPQRGPVWTALLLFLAVGGCAGSSMMKENPAAGQRSANELWVTSQGTNTVHVLKFPGTGPMAKIALPVGAGPHIITFHAGKYAYVSGMGDGTLYVIDADARRVVKAMKLGPAGVHQARVSPDGTAALVTVVANRGLVKLAVDEAQGAWSEAGSLSLANLEKAPVCTIFRSDGKRAYVSLMPSGLAIVDVPSMALVNTLSTDGFVACGMIKSADGTHAVLASSGGGGHVYTLDLAKDTLTDRGTLGMADWHSFNMTPDEKLGVGTSPKSDEIVFIDLTAQPVKKLGTLVLNPRPGSGNNQPDAIGGGEPIRSGILPVSLRAAGQLALVNLADRSVKSYIPIAPPSTFDPMTCQGCAVHGVTIRPLGDGSQQVGR
jgi:hypothetical protein